MNDPLGVHEHHCCVLHGCKYGDDDNCPVVNEVIDQKYPCEECEECEECDVDSVEELQRYIETQGLKKLVKIFLSERREGDGDSYAPVLHTDMIMLNQIIHKLIKLKFGGDADGDYPVLYDVTNVHTHTQVNIPSIHKTSHGELPKRELRHLAKITEWANERISRLVESIDDEH